MDANDVVTAILPLGSDLLVSGKFTMLGGTIDYTSGQSVQTGGTRRRGFARVAGGAVLDWGPEVSLLVPASYGAWANATCWALGVQGEKIFLGGDFVSFGGVNRSKIAAIDLGTGRATGWNPNPDQIVRIIVTSPQGIYVGGNFANIGGKARPRIGLLKYEDGSADDWDPNLQTGKYIGAIALSPSSVIESWSEPDRKRRSTSNVPGRV